MACKPAYILYFIRVKRHLAGTVNGSVQGVTRPGFGARGQEDCQEKKIKRLVDALSRHVSSREECQVVCPAALLYAQLAVWAWAQK